MRLAALAFSTVLLSGCSWIGFGPQAGHPGQQHAQGGQYNAPQGHYGQQARRGQQQQQSRGGPCTITKVTQPAPRGCRPEQVTVALPQYGGGQQPGYSGQGYQQPSAGSYGAGYGGQVPTTRRSSLKTDVVNRPYQRQRFRVNGSIGVERSMSGTAFNSTDLASLYDASTHAESFVEGTQAGGLVTNTDYRVSNVTPISPSVSFSDLYGSAATLKGGAEYFVTPSTSLTADASYSAAAGRSGGGVTYEGDLTQVVRAQPYTDNGMGPTPNGAPSINATTLLNLPVAKSQFEINDMQRFGLEVGARHYFKPAFNDHLERPITPFVGASAGAQHYNALEVSQHHDRLYLNEYWNSGRADTDLSYFRHSDTGASEVLEAGWVPSGAVNLGLEWQATPNGSIGFETGIRYEGPRSKTAGGETDANISIPLTLRGSIGF